MPVFYQAVQSQVVPAQHLYLWSDLLHLSGGEEVVEDRVGVASGHLPHSPSRFTFSHFIFELVVALSLRFLSWNDLTKQV